MGTKCHFDSLEDVNLCYAVCDKKKKKLEFSQAFPVNLTNDNPCMKVVLTELSKLVHADLLTLAVCRENMNSGGQMIMIVL